MSRRRIPHGRSRSRRSGPATQIPVRRKGALRKVGYSTQNEDDLRQAALDRAVKRHGALSVYRMLNLQAVYRKGEPIGDEDIFLEDAKYVKQSYTDPKTGKFTS